MREAGMRGWGGMRGSSRTLEDACIKEGYLRTHDTHQTVLSPNFPNSSSWLISSSHGDEKGCPRKVHWYEVPFLTPLLPRYCIQEWHASFRNTWRTEEEWGGRDSEERGVTKGVDKKGGILREVARKKLILRQTQ